MTTQTLPVTALSRTSLSAGCRLLACAALSLAITLLTVTTIANSVNTGPRTPQTAALAASLAPAAPASLRIAG